MQPPRASAALTRSTPAPARHRARDAAVESSAIFRLGLSLASLLPGWTPCSRHAFPAPPSPFPRRQPPARREMAVRQPGPRTLPADVFARDLGELLEVFPFR